MKFLLNVCLLTAFTQSAIAAAKPPAKKAKAPTTASVVRTLLQMEQDWSQAGVRKDSTAIDRIIAEDWVSVDFQGHTVTKAQALAELRSAKVPAQPIDMGEMKVRVFGDMAVVSGQDRSGKYAWMDVFIKRTGRWQAVASQSTKVEK